MDFYLHRVIYFFVSINSMTVMMKWKSVSKLLTEFYWETVGGRIFKIDQILRSYVQKIKVGVSEFSVNISISPFQQLGLMSNILLNYAHLIICDKSTIKHASAFL